MKTSKTHFWTQNIALAGILCLAAAAPGNPLFRASAQSSSMAVWSANLAGSMSMGMPEAVDEKVPDTFNYRIAQRLHSRVLRQRGTSPSVHHLKEAIDERQRLLKKNLVVTLATDENPTYEQWKVSVSEYPTWIVANITYGSATFGVSPSRIRSTLKKERIIDLDEPQDTELLSVTGALAYRTGMTRAFTTGVAKTGHVLDEHKTAATLAKLFMSSDTGAVIPLITQAGTIVNKTGVSLGELQLLASGHSNFKGSDYNRIANVRKAIREHINNIVVPPGETFSFNRTLDGPVEISNGWYMAKVIFNGDELRPSPGGGICQASTTAYRAILNAGFPVVDRRSHSLYVSYYEPYGVGIDATIFPGEQDLTFLNDTGNYLLIQAYDDGFEAVVNIYGTPDGRKVALEGPFLKGNAPEGFTYEGRPLHKNEIVWRQSVEYVDGRTREDTIYSKYKYIPGSVQTKYADVTPELVARSVGTATGL